MSGSPYSELEDKQFKIAQQTESIRVAKPGERVPIVMPQAARPLYRFHLQSEEAESSRQALATVVAPTMHEAFAKADGAVGNLTVWQVLSFVEE